MTSKFDERLTKILEDKRDLDRSAAEDAARVKAKQEDEERRKTLAWEKWRETAPTLEAIVKRVSDRLSEVDLHLSVLNAPTTSPAIAQFSVLLHEGPNKKDKQLVLNVSAYGLVQPVMLIPHTGRTRKNLNIMDATPDDYEELLLDFLDQAIAGGRKESEKTFR